jgi:riboflavin biosynthesis pyrimidine reductase
MKEPLAVLNTVYDATSGALIALPDVLASFYGPLRLSAPTDRAYVTSNFVSTLDGVVSLGEPGTGGDEISGGSREDRCVMGLLRALADVIIVGAGTLRSFPRHVWTPQTIYQPYADAFAQLRQARGRAAAPLTVVVTAKGDLDLGLPVFTTATAPAVVVTTEAGARALHGKGRSIPVKAAGPGPFLSAAEILGAVGPAVGDHVLLECGPELMGRFVADRAVDELFLTLAPQFAGRAAGQARQGLVAGAVFLPADPRWAELVGLKRCGSVLFLRYRLNRQR